MVGLLKGRIMNFILVNIARTGTRTFSKVISSHPDIALIRYNTLINPKVCFVKDYTLIKDRVLELFNENKGIPSIGIELNLSCMTKDVIHKIVSSSEFKDFKIIFLKRENFLDRVVSLNLMKQGFPKHYTYPLDKVTIPIEICELEFKKTEQDYLKFESINCDYLLVKHEDLVKDTQRVNKEIHKFLEVKEMEIPLFGKKENKLPLNKSLLNYKELKEHFANTKWQKYFK